MVKKIFFILLCVSWWAEAEAQVFEMTDGYQTPGGKATGNVVVADGVCMGISPIS